MHSGQLTLNNLSEGELAIVLGTLRDHGGTLQFDARGLRSHNPALLEASVPVASSSLPHVRLHPPFGWPSEQHWPPVPAHMPGSVVAHEAVAGASYDNAVFTWMDDAGFLTARDLLQRLSADLDDVSGRSQQRGADVLFLSGALPVHEPVVRSFDTVHKDQDQLVSPTETEAQRLWREQEKNLDDALKDTFPASDPIAPGRPT